MTRFTRAVPLATLASAVLLSAACRRQPDPVVPVTPTVNQDSIARERARQDSINAARAAADRAAALERARRDSVAAAEAARRTSAAELNNSLVAAIHFDYDRAEILDQDRATLDRKAAILQANPNVRLRVSGHADERGSDEYNMALGQRRAAAARRYLESRGVAAARIDILSLGEERPVCESHEESCWAQNRRAEFEIVGGGGTLVAPR